VTYLLLESGFKDIIVCDSKGIINTKREDLNEDKYKLAQKTNPKGLSGGLGLAMSGADIFIGLSAPGILTGDMIRSMASDPIVFAMANPIPEIDYNDAVSSGAKVVATGRSDYPNQINNLLVFPGLIKGSLLSRKKVDNKIKIKAAQAIADIVSEEELEKGIIVPSPFNPLVVEKVTQAVLAQ
jgi:malate dehydrogenase (oxaloacetate-decarboxylating)